MDRDFQNDDRARKHNTEPIMQTRRRGPAERSNLDMEMDGHTLGAKGMRTITTALKDVTPTVTKVYMLGESRTILQALESGATPFNDLFANRIGEVYDCIR